MFKNLDGFKKVKQDEHSVTMQHKKGHVITVAMKALPAVHRKQLMALPLHEPKSEPVKLADGGPPVPTSLPAPADYQPQEQVPDVNPDDQRGAAQMQALQGGKVQDNEPQKESVGASGSWDGPNAAEQAPEQAQQSAASPSSAQSSGQNISPMSAYSLQAQGLKEQAAGQRLQNEGEKAATEDYQKSYQEAVNSWQTTQKQMSDQIKSALADVQNGHINPKQYQENMSSGQKVAAAIGLFLGGLSAPYSHNGNPALDMLNKQVDRDIDAQKSNLNNKMNIYHAYLSQYNNAAVAENMTRATMLGIYGNKMKMAALNSADPQIKARLDMGLGQIQNAIIPQLLNAQLMNEGAKFSGSHPNQGGSEQQYQVYLNNAQAMNPALYKDAQEKYIPGVGTTAIPVKKEDIEALSTFKNLNNLAKEAQDFAQTNGRTMYGTEANQKANDIASQLRLQIGQLVNLKRINEYEAEKYDNLIKSPGSWNQGAALQSFKDFRNDIQSKTKSVFDQYQVKPFRK